MAISVNVGLRCGLAAQAPFKDVVEVRPDVATSVSLFPTGTLRNALVGGSWIIEQLGGEA